MKINQRNFDGDARLEGAEVHAYVSNERYILKAFVFGTEKIIPKPCVIFFHGGSWEGGSPGQFGEQCKYLSSLGVVAITFEYRLQGFHQTSPIECVADAKTAYRWVKANGERLGVDIEKIVVAGASAGGHVALTLALIDDFHNESDDYSISIDPKALVLFNPVVKTTGERWLEKFRENAEKLSPVHQVTKKQPPVILFHGEDDDVVPLAEVKELEARFKQFQSSFELHVFSGKGHGFFNYNKGLEGCYAETVALMEAFLVSIDWIKNDE